MAFRTNLSKHTLFANDKVKIYFDDKTVEFVPPSLHSYFNDQDFSEFMFLIRQTPEQFNQNTKKTGFIVESRYGILKTLLHLKYKGDFIDNYTIQLFPNVSIIDSLLYFEGIELTKEEYEILLTILAISCGEEDLEKFLTMSESSSKDNEVQRHMKEQQAKIDNAKKKKKESSGSKITTDQIVIGILYEFPSLSLDRIYDMNVFTLLELWKYVTKVVDTQIQVVAAGNGLTKEFTYFIN